MVDELKIKVGVTGGQEAQAQLAGVAAAEQKVAGASAAGVPVAQTAAATTAKLTDEQKKGGEAAEFLTGRKLRLINSLRMLSPELGLAAEGIKTLSEGATGMALASGIAALAVVGLAEIIGKLTAADAEQKRHAQELQNALAQQAQEYGRAAVEAEKLYQAERRRADLHAAQATPAEILKPLAAAGQELGFGRSDIELAGKVMGAGNIPPDQAKQVLAFVGGGFGKGQTDPRRLSHMFKSRMGQAGFAGELDAETQARLGRLPPAEVAAMRTEAAGLTAGISPEGQQAGIWEAAFAREKLRGGKAKDVAEFQEYVGRHVRNAVYGEGEVSEQSLSYLRNITDANQELRGVSFAFPESYTWMGNAQAAAPGKGLTLNQVIHNHYGSTYNSPYSDPAGQPRDNQAP